MCNSVLNVVIFRILLSFNWSSGIWRQSEMGFKLVPVWPDLLRAAWWIYIILGAYSPGGVTAVVQIGRHQLRRSHRSQNTTRPSPVESRGHTNSPKPKGPIGSRRQIGIFAWKIIKIMNPLSKLLFNSDNQLIVRLDIVFDIKMLSFPGLKGCVIIPTYIHITDECLYFLRATTVIPSISQYCNIDIEIFGQKSCDVWFCPYHPALLIYEIRGLNLICVVLEF